MPQREFGATVAKPTGLLAPSSRSICTDDSLRKLVVVAIGRNPDGSFKASCHEEYPAKFSAEIAQAFTQIINEMLELSAIGLFLGRLC